MKRHGIRRKGLSNADLAALVAPILRESPRWAYAVRAMFHGDRQPLAALFEGRDPIPLSVRPVLARLARGEKLRLTGRPMEHDLDVTASA
jgi:hypothetical protein